MDLALINRGLQTGQQNEQAYLQDQGRENFEACIICLLLELSHFSSTAYLQGEDIMAPNWVCTTYLMEVQIPNGISIVNNGLYRSSRHVDQSRVVYAANHFPVYQCVCTACLLAPVRGSPCNLDGVE